LQKAGQTFGGVTQYLQRPSKKEAVALVAHYGHILRSSFRMALRFWLVTLKELPCSTIKPGAAGEM
jgi:hypothetical protein